MGYKAKTPEGGRGRDRWSFYSTAGKEKWTGWLAGKTQWFMCHRVPQSKPCAACFTEGELKCLHCSKGWVPYWWGYTPLYRESDGKAVLVGVLDNLYDALRGMHRFQHVQVSRGAEKTDGVGIQPLLAGSDYKPYRPDRINPPVLWPFLWRLWKLPELESWWSNNQEEPTDGASSRPCGSAGDPADSVAGLPPARLEFLDPGSWQRALAENEKLKAEREARVVLMNGHVPKEPP